MDIYTVIRNDHQKAKAVIAEIEALPNERHAQRMKLFRALKLDLVAHNDAEEDSFYVALSQHSKTRSDAETSAKEHHEANAILTDLDDDDLEPAEWRQKFVDLHKALDAHISKEEGKVFEEARAVFSEKTATDLAREMELLKKEKQLVLKQAS